MLKITANPPLNGGYNKEANNLAALFLSASRGRMALLESDKNATAKQR